MYIVQLAHMHIVLDIWMASKLKIDLKAQVFKTSLLDPVVFSRQLGIVNLKTHICIAYNHFQDLNGHNKKGTAYC